MYVLKDLLYIEIKNTLKRRNFIGIKFRYFANSKFG